MPTTPTSAVDAAIAKAKSTKKWAVGMCDNFVANMYGYANSGYATAVANWNATPTNLKHAGDMSAPAGALMYWGGGSGHVALSLGNGSIVSTDIGGNGTVTTVPATEISEKWGKTYLGWTYPYFQGEEATNTLGGITGTTPVGVQQAGLTSIDPSSISDSFVSSVTAPLNTLMSSVVWGFELLVGLGLVGISIFVIVRQK
jgi:hypothetical protein